MAGAVDRKPGLAGESTRAALAAAAVTAIVEEGWQAAGSRSVTRRAGVPLGALNYHFGTKEALFRTAAMAQVAAMFATPWRIITSGATLADLVIGMLGWSRSADVTATQQALLLEVMAQSRRDPDLATDLAASLDGYREALAGALRQLRIGRAGHDAVTDDAVELAAAFAGHCNGMWLQGVVEPAAPPGATAQAQEVWLAALRA